MIDTLKCGFRFQSRAVKNYMDYNNKIKDILINRNSNLYKSKFFKIKIVKDKKIPKYDCNIKIYDISNKDRYVLFNFFRFDGYQNAYDFKFRSELSHFKTIHDFDRFIKGIAPNNQFWEYLIDNSIPQEVHLNIDVRMLFDFFRVSLDYSYCKNPFIQINPDTLKRTLYLTGHYYIYEKKHLVRIERRYLTARNIKNEFQWSNYQDIKTHSRKCRNPFTGLKFYNHAKLKDKIDINNVKYYVETLRIMRNKQIYKTIENSKEVWKMKNSLVNAKEIINKKHKNKFSNKIAKYLTPVKFNFNNQFKNESISFFTKGESNV